MTEIEAKIRGYLRDIRKDQIETARILTFKMHEEFPETKDWKIVFGDVEAVNWLRDWDEAPYLVGTTYIESMKIDPPKKREFVCACGEKFKKFKTMKGFNRHHINHVKATRPRPEVEKP